MPLKAATFVSPTWTLTIPQTAAHPQLPLPHCLRLDKRPRAEPVRHATATLSAPSSQPSPQGGDPVMPGTQLGKLKVGPVVSRQAYSTTYEAETDDGNDVHAKIVSLRLQPTWEPLDDLRAETTLLRTLQTRALPNFVDAYDFDQGSDTLFVLLTTPPPGRPLRTLLDIPRNSLHVVHAVLSATFSALAELHALTPAITHNAVSPNNILFDEVSECATLVNLSLQAEEGARLAANPGYAPLVSGGPSSDDVYSAAACALHLLTGESPETMRDPVAVITEFTPAQRSRLGNMYVVLARALAMDPAERYPDAAAALAELSVSNEASTDVELRSSVAVETMASPAPVSTLQTRGTERPLGARSSTRRTSGELQVRVRARGPSASGASRGLFGVVWTGMTAAWTVAALTTPSGLAARLMTTAFSGPFWATGLRIFGDALQYMLGEEELLFARDAFRADVRLSIGRQPRRLRVAGVQWAACRGLVACVEEVTEVVEDASFVADLHDQGVVRRRHGNTVLVLRDAWRREYIVRTVESVDEQVWLRDEINAFLADAVR